MSWTIHYKADKKASEIATDIKAKSMMGAWSAFVVWRERRGIVDYYQATAEEESVEW
jgi:hypothetical protein